MRIDNPKTFNMAHRVLKNNSCSQNYQGDKVLGRASHTMVKGAKPSPIPY